MRYRVTFEERTEYTVEFEAGHTPPTEETWFDLMDADRPDWPTKSNILLVEERNLIRLGPVKAKGA